MSDMKASIALRLIDEFSRPLRQLTQNFERFKASTERFRELRDDAARLGQAAAGISAFGSKAQQALTGPVNVATALEEHMAAVRVLAQASVPEIERLSAAARGVGLSSQYSAAQVAASQAVLARAGWRAGDILGGLPSIMALAQAGSTDLTTSARSLSDVLGGFALDASEAKRVTAALATAASAAETPVAVLANAMAALSGQAAELGMKAEETTALLGGALKRGVTADQLAPAMSSVLGTLASARTQSNAVFRSLGVSVTDATGRTRRLADVLADVNSAMKNFEPSDRMEVLGRLFPGQAHAADLIARAAGDGDVSATERAIADAGPGALPEVAPQTLGSSLKAMAASAAGLAEILGAQLLPLLQALADTTTKVVRAVAGWMQEHPLLTRVVGVTLAITAGLTTVIAGLLGALAAASVSAGFLGVGIASLRTTLQVLGGSLVWLRARFLSLASTLAAQLVAAAARATTAVGQLAATIVGRLVATTAMAAREVVRFSSTLVMQAVRGAVNAAQAMLMLAGSLAGRLFPTVVAAGRQVALFAVQLARAAAVTVGQAATSVATFVGSLVRFGSAMIAQAIAPMTTFIASLLRMAAALVGQAMAAVAAFAVRIGALAVVVLTKAVASTAAFIGSLLTMAGSLIVAAVPALLAATGAVISFGLALLATPVGWVAAAVLGLIAVGVLLWQQWGNITYLFKEGWLAVRSALIDAGMAVLTAWTKVGDFFDELWAGIKASFDEAVAGVMDKVKALLALVESVRRRLPSWAGGAAGGEPTGPYGPPVPTVGQVREAARAARAAEQPPVQDQRFSGVMRLEVDDRRIRAVGMESSRGLDLELDTGLAMAGAL